MFRWKLLHFILPCNVNLKQWKIINTEQCKFCKQVEDYSHMLIDCSFNESFLNEIIKLLRQLQIDRHVISLKTFVFGYKVSDKKYNDLNLFLTLVSFSLYKSHMMSDQKSKIIDTFKVFKNEMKSLVEVRMFLGKTIGCFTKKVMNLLY